jgi:nucleotide-binding universal stress UspA family protein
VSFTQILCPVDLSPLAPAQLDRAIALAGAAPARILVVHALDPVRLRAAGPFVAASVRADAEDALRQLVEEGRRRARGRAVAIESALTEGLPEAVILAHARSARVDVVVMTASASGDLAGAGFGSTLGRVLCATTVPVLAWPAAKAGRDATPEPPIRHVVAALDFAYPSMAVGRVAAEVARNLGADVTLLHVVPAASGGRGSGVARTLRGERAGHVLALLAEEIGDARLPVRAEVREGIASEEIAAATGAQADTLAVIGLRHASWGAAPPGSTVLRVLRAGGFPVLAVPAKTATRSVHDRPWARRAGHAVAG